MLDENLHGKKDKNSTTVFGYNFFFLIKIVFFFFFFKTHIYIHCKYPRYTGLDVFNVKDKHTHYFFL